MNSSDMELNKIVNRQSRNVPAPLSVGARLETD